MDSSPRQEEISELPDNEEAPRAHSPNYLLIVEHETSSIGVLAADLDGGRTLAVFSFAEEADTKVSVIMDKTRAIA